MDREMLAERKKKLLEEVERAKTLILMHQGALRLIDELLRPAPDPKAESK